jgi:hypothetical protein
MTIISAMSEPTDKELKQAWANTPITQTPQPVKTLRDEFAMADLVAIIGKTPFQQVPIGDVSEIVHPYVIGAYAYADAMMKQREA